MKGEVFDFCAKYRKARWATVFICESRSSWHCEAKCVCVLVWLLLACSSNKNLFYLNWAETACFHSSHFGPIDSWEIHPYSRLEKRPTWIAFVCEWLCSPDSSESKDRFSSFWSCRIAFCPDKLWYLIYKHLCTVDIMYIYYFW